MSLETEVKNLTEAVLGLTAAIQAGGTPAASPVTDTTDDKAEARAKAAAKAKAEAKAKAAKEAEEAEAAAEAALLDDEEGIDKPTVSRAELLNLVKSLVKAKKLKEATDILKDHGAAKVSELDESDYDEVYAELKALED